MYGQERSLKMILEKKGLVFWAAFFVAAASVFAQSESLYILFPANSAELRSLGSEQAIRNSQVLVKVAQVLLEDPKCRMLIDGHANPIVGTIKEETGTLKPLSSRRASVAADFLVTYYGVDRNRLILTGAGGSYPAGEGDPGIDRRVSFFKIPPK